MVVRTSRVSEEMNESIRQISKLGQGWDGKWFPVDATQRNRLIKYRPNSKKPSEWDEELPKKFRKNIRENILGKVLDDEKKELYYDVACCNLLKNDGRIDYDQQPHTDYPPRLLM